VKTRLPFAIAALALLFACKGKEEKAAETPDVLSGVPILEGSQLLERSGTSEAARMAFFVQQVPDSVAASYRRFLTASGWRVVGDVSDKGGTDLYVEREGPPLWIQIRPAERGFTRYTLIGALGRSAARQDSGAGAAGQSPSRGDTAR
jgi:hypothetical protein